MGIAAMLFGVVSIPLRVFRPQTFHKLDAFKRCYGKTPGTLMHWAFYTVLPLLFGAYLACHGYYAQ